MLMKWCDLKPGDILVISDVAKRKRANQSWTQNSFYIDSLFILTDIERIDEEHVRITLQDSEYKGSSLIANINMDGAVMGHPDHPLFEIVSVAGEAE